MAGSTDVVIVGAGPYGLSLAAHLAARGVPRRIFGKPMQSWLNMPAGIGLKSPDFATNIYTPISGTRFVDWCRERRISTAEPCAIELFAEYGRWIQERIVSDVEQVDVATVTAVGGGFMVQLTDGERVECNALVVATGLSYYARMPQLLASLPKHVVTHTATHGEYRSLAGRRVAVVGGGASALEASVLLHEAGAHVDCLIRGAEIRIGTRPREYRSLRDRIVQPMSVMGHGRKSFVMEKLPMAVHFLPDHRRVRLARTYLGPAAAWWLRERLEPVRVRTNARIVRADMTGAAVLRLAVETRTGEELLEVDHVVCGTGYEVNVDRLAFLAPSLRARLARIEKAPRLSRAFESSVPRLFFVGPAAAMSFGPLFRFVAGAEHAVARVTRQLVAHRRGNAVVAALRRQRQPAA